MRLVKIGMAVAVLAALLSVGCAGKVGTCERSSAWDSEFDPKPAYAREVSETFQLDDVGKPARHVAVFGRLEYLEKYCYQTRIK